MKSGEPQTSISVNFVPALEEEAHKLRAEVGSLRAQLSTLKEEAERLRKGQREGVGGDDGFVVPEKVEEAQAEKDKAGTMLEYPMPEPAVWHNPVAPNRAEFKESDQPDSDMCLELHVRVSGILRDKHVTIKMYGSDEENISRRLEHLATRRRGIEEWCRINLIGRQVHSEMKVEVETECGNRRKSFDTHMINARPKLRELYRTLRKKGYVIGKMVESAKQKKASQLS
jgi:hypothetical protein